MKKIVYNVENICDMVKGVLLLIVNGLKILKGIKAKQNGEVKICYLNSLDLWLLKRGGLALSAVEQTRIAKMEYGIVMIVIMNGRRFLAN